MTSAQPLSAPASQAEFFASLQKYTLAFSRMKPAVEFTTRDRALGVEGYVVVWNVPKESGVAKGGCRVSPTVTLDEVAMLARTMALKNAAAGLPLGGCKSGVRGNPDAPSFKAQYQSIARRFAPLFPEHGGPFGGLGFDLGARPQFIDWFIEATGLPHRFTGKPAALGGTDYDVEGIAGLGVAAAARAALESGGGTAGGTCFAVQGLGAMGAGVVRYFSEYGGRLAALSDVFLGGSWRLPADLDGDVRARLTTALASMDKATVRELVEAHGEAIGPVGAVLYEEVDVLFPCAVHDVIHPGNHDDVRAGMVVEGANGPCKAESREALQARGVLVVPDFLANSGGIIAAHVEMTGGSGDLVARAKQRTTEVIGANVRQVLDLSSGLSVSPYEAARYMALVRLFEGAAPDEADDEA